MIMKPVLVSAVFTDSGFRAEIQIIAAEVLPLLPFWSTADDT